MLKTEWDELYYLLCKSLAHTDFTRECYLSKIAVKENNRLYKTLMTEAAKIRYLHYE